MSEQEQDFTNSGAFKVNNQFATGIRYEIEQANGEVTGGTVSFLVGRKQVAKEAVSSKDELMALVGEENTKNMLDNKGASKGSSEEKLKGKLQAEDLHYKESETKAFAVNEIEQSNEREQDARLKEFLELQRQDMRRIREEVQSQPAPGYSRDRDAPQPEESPFSAVPGKKAEQTKADDKAIPSSVAARYVKLDEKYHFHDKTLAFEDKGTRLSTKSQNSQVIKDLITIAESRNWDSIRVRGNEEFRRAAWLEASQRGLEVSGYKPTEVEKAHLMTLLQRDGKDKSADQNAGRSNSIEQGQNRERATEAAQSQQQPLGSSGKASRTSSEQQQGAGRQTGPGVIKEEQTQGEEPPKPNVHRGTLLEHGKDFYNHDKKESESYFVKYRADNGNERELWGQDLERAINDAGVKKGDRIDLEYKGKEPVRVTREIKDDQGKVLGSEQIETHRSTWSVEKVKSFNNDTRDKALEKHPELTAAYVTMSAGEKFAANQWPDDKNKQAEFTAALRETLSQMMENGERVPTPAVTKNKSNEQQTAKEKSKTLDQDKELSR
ncbi:MULTISPECIES: LPD7 domain-containing protein [unclassified Pantoea]|uniref:LPD7 domain-containing protein n=1 Tax=unclassified Pantoea TaxID=2630326 RepID=UPI0012327EF7|nr:MULTISPECIES: LPD7 domain-containing protein [unclassified Pantoea]KAA6093903.1 hypothetical protein F3I21_22475 [Pantoea sp. B_9]KAA6106524.1 hypothetical protein F3I18_23300 [Pantoea sp. B_10]